MSSQAAGSRPARAATAPRAADGTAAGTWRLGALWRRSSVKVGVLTAAAAVAYCLDSLILFRRFLASTFDLVIFDQGIRGYAHLAAPVSLARGVSDGQGAHFMLLADHWSPVLALLAPLYRIHDGPGTLLVAQAVLFALAIPPLWVYTRRRLGPGAAYFTCVAYALSLPVMEAVIFDFHEVAFVPVLTAVMVERFDAGKRWHAVAVAVALLLVKEDMGLLVAGFGGYLLLTRRRAEVWTGLGFVAGGVAATWIATHVLIPAFGGSATFYWAYGQFGPTLGSALLNVITHPWHALHVFVTPWVKARTMIGLLAMFGFLPLASPMVIAVLPLLAERMLASGYPLWWQAKFQYDAFLVMMLCCAAVDGAARLQKHWPDHWLTYPFGRPGWLRRDGGPWPLATLWAAGICAAALVYLPSSPFGSLLHPNFYGVNARMRAAAAAVAHVPAGAEVEASNNIGPALSGRDTVLLLDGTPRWAPWVVGDTIGLDFPFCRPSQQAQEVSYLRAHGYTQVFGDGGYVVLHRPADARTAQALAHPLPANRLHTNICY
ncbi:MAG TPA: DUF2079 domain-containing protein [Streptosporangiaceae bacterium]|nr:DUF2079 domain-containing protein [Streptosporangiaceae bacterium]